MTYKHQINKKQIDLSEIFVPKLFELENDYKQLDLEYSKWQQIIGKIEK